MSLRCSCEQYFVPFALIACWNFNDVIIGIGIDHFFTFNDLLSCAADFAFAQRSVYIRVVSRVPKAAKEREHKTRARIARGNCIAIASVAQEIGPNRERIKIEYDSRVWFSHI